MRSERSEGEDEGSCWQKYTSPNLPLPICRSRRYAALRPAMSPTWLPWLLLLLLLHCSAVLPLVSGGASDGMSVHLGGPCCACEWGCE